MPTPSRPHIIITIADDHRYDALSAIDSPDGPQPWRTASLDRLVDSGTCFRRTYIPGSPHGAVCAPSRAMLHTGRTYFRVNDYFEPHGNSGHIVPTLGGKLRDTGYHTAGVGKWHNCDPAFRASFEFGRSVFHGGMSSHFCCNHQDYVPDTAGELTRRGNAGHSTDIFTRAAIESLNRYKQSGDDRPLFLYVAYTAPHDPRDTHYRYRKQYPLESIPLPKSFMPRHPFDHGVLGGRDEELAESPRDPDEIRQHNADYAAILHHMDDGIGSIHAAANAAGLTTDNTLFIHTADHGIAIGRHGLMGKQNVYDHAMRPPLIVAGPGFEKGIDDNNLRYMQDLHPTLLDRAGAATNDPCDFADLQASTPRDAVGSAYSTFMRMVRADRYKLIRTLVEDREYTQLFDLETDPHELENLADRPEHAGTVETLRAKLGDWQSWAGDDAKGFAAASS